MTTKTLTLTATNAGGSVQASATVVVADPPPPSGVVFPAGPSFVPNYQEYAFSDRNDSNANGAAVAIWQTQLTSEAYLHWYGQGPPLPGFYNSSKNSGVPFRHKLGDWADANNLPQGSTAFATITAGSSAANAWYSANVFGLVRKWLDGTYRNAGVFLRGSTSNTKIWSTSYATALDPLGKVVKPYLRLTTSLGPVDVPATRSIWLNTSSYSAQAKAITGRTSANTDALLLWFDLSQYSVPDVTDAVLWIYGGTGASGSQATQIMRCVHPADHAGDGGGTPLEPQRLGIAAQYPLDQGIAAHPSILLDQKFADANWEKLMTGAPTTGGALMTAPDGNGFTKLAGIYNGCRFWMGKDRSYSFHFSPWRGTPLPGSGYRLKPYVELEEAYVRTYIMFGLDWDPQPLQGGKTGPGFDGRYTSLTSTIAPYPCNQIPGMGAGNSGSPADGFSGWSGRCNFDQIGAPGDALADIAGMGSGDFYHADMAMEYGHDVPWNKHLLGKMRKGEWNCVELYMKMNSVTDPTQRTRRIVSLTQVGGVATAVLEKPETDPAFAVGQKWQVQGLYPNYSPNTKNQLYRGEKIITSIIDERTFTYAIDPTVNSPAIVGSAKEGKRWLVCAPCRGNWDGILRAWVNGYLAAEYLHIRFRHVKWRTDGGLYGIDAMWMAGFIGGDPGVATGHSTQYFSNLLFGTEYIGPMVLS